MTCVWLLGISVNKYAKVFYIIMGLLLWGISVLQCLFSVSALNISWKSGELKEQYRKPWDNSHTCTWQNNCMIFRTLLKGVWLVHLVIFRGQKSYSPLRKAAGASITRWCEKTYRQADEQESRKWFHKSPDKEVDIKYEVRCRPAVLSCIIMSSSNVWVLTGVHIRITAT